MSSNKIRSGKCCVSLTCADIPELLTYLANQNIVINDVTVQDPLTAIIFICYKDLPRMKVLVHKRGGTVRALYIRGVVLWIREVLKRPVLVLGLLIVFLLTWYVPTRVLFVKISGNQTISEKKILECVENAGIRFGTSSKSVRSETVKNQMLQMLPQLQWVGVTMRGCVAEVSLIEGPVSEDAEYKPPISNIVAVCDGVITQATVVNGDPLCKVGQAVKKGQILISGYSDLGLAVKATRAQGEIYAMTKRDITVKSVGQGLQRGRIVASETRYSLLIGKKLIKFYNNSGILPPGCVKMYRKIPLTMADGLSLPVWLYVETWYNYELIPTTVTDNEGQLEAEARKYITELMIAGSILHSWEERSPDSSTVHANYICNEMIGQEVAEEYIERNGKNR